MAGKKAHKARQPGTTLAYWIAQALRHQREAAGVSRANLALTLGVSDATLKRLESGSKMPPDIEARVAAYAWILGLKDGRELWQQAVEDWVHHGKPPEFQLAEGPAGAFAEAIRQAALRQLRDDASRRGGRRSSVNHRAVR